MTATEELRRLLNESSVKWGSGFGGDTLWTGRHGIEWRWNKQEGTLAMYSRTITPEQAIEATLGDGTCEVEGYDDGVDEGMDGEWYSYVPPTWYLSCGHRCEGSERPRYCPVCGKRVVEEGA